MKVSLSETASKFRSEKPIEAQLFDKILELERRIAELEKNNRINAVSPPNQWDELRKQSKYNSTPFYLKTAIP